MVNIFSRKARVKHWMAKHKHALVLQHGYIEISGDTLHNVTHKHRKYLRKNKHVITQILRERHLIWRLSNENS